MKILGIIPARSGSKGVRNKNIKLLRSKPLIYWTIKTALKSKLDNIIVSTDSLKIKKISEKYGANVPFMRPNNISRDNSKTIDVVKHALKFYKKKKINFDAVMILQPTCPFRKVVDIDKSINILKKRKDISSVISLQKVESFHPARMKFLKRKIIKNPNFIKSEEATSRQRLKKVYLRSGLIYLTKIETILKKNSLQGNKSFGLITPVSRSLNIDNINDFRLAELIFKKKYKITD